MNKLAAGAVIAAAIAVPASASANGGSQGSTITVGSAPQSKCPAGGLTITVNGSPYYVCNGQNGANGTNGSNGGNGSTGPQGPQGNPGTPGQTGATGPQGVQGIPGQDGQTPYIGQNGDWFIGSTDTGVDAQGVVGDQGPAGANGRDAYITSGTIPAGGSANTPTGVVTCPAGGEFFESYFQNQPVNATIGAVCNGTDGTNGTNGTDGSTGATGPQGPTGDTGPMGGTGQQGPVGPAGPTSTVTTTIVQPTETIQVPTVPKVAWWAKGDGNPANVNPFIVGRKGNKLAVGSFTLSDIKLAKRHRLYVKGTAVLSTTSGTSKVRIRFYNPIRRGTIRQQAWGKLDYQFGLHGKAKVYTARSYHPGSFTSNHRAGR